MPKFCALCGAKLKKIATPGWMRRRFHPMTGHAQEWVGEIVLDCPQGERDVVLGSESGHSVAIVLKPGAWRDTPS